MTDTLRGSTDPAQPGANQPLLPAIVELARRSRMLRATDLCQVIGTSTDDCTALLDGYVAQGLMRRTVASLGNAAYYWICSDPASVDEPTPGVTP